MDDAIHNRMMDALQVVKQNGHTPIYIALIGSQNYGLSTPSSDYDFKCIVLPSLTGLCKREGDVSKVYSVGSGEVDVKDIHSFVSILCKMNPQYLEPLITRHYMADEAYAPLLSQLRDLAPELVKEMRLPLLHAIQGMVRNKLVEIKHGISFNRKYDGKKLYQAYRFYRLASFVREGKFPLVLPEEDRLFCQRCRNGEFSSHKAESMCRDWNNELLTIFNGDSLTVSSVSKEEAVRLAAEIQLQGCLQDAQQIMNQRKENTYAPIVFHEGLSSV